MGSESTQGIPEARVIQVVDHPRESLAARLEEARRRLGLTTVRAAYLLGTEPQQLDAYAAGRRADVDGLEERVEALVALGPNSAYAEEWPVTLASTADALRSDRRAGATEADMLRVIISAADDFGRLMSGADQWFFLACPETTGSGEWDALLAALAVHLCRQARLDRTPAWTRHSSRYLQRTWWVGVAGEVESLRALALRDSPSAFRARGVMLSGQTLASL